MIDPQSIRIDGIYRQRQEGFFMQRVKLAAGVISAEQARSVARVARQFGQGTIHLTSRGSMEIHWLKENDLPLVKRELAKVGLTSRGACGGAVRGICCANLGTLGFATLEALARRLHRHFTGNPRCEGLPKKFKIGIEADATGGRHLIQDVGLVLTKEVAGQGWYDIWIAGGLGREPQPGFLLAEGAREERLIPIIEAVIRVYATHAPPPKRLKFLAREFGAEKLRQLIEAEPVFHEELPPPGGLPEQLAPTAADRQRLDLPVFAGELSSDQLGTLAEFAEAHADGVLLVTANQDLAFLLADGLDIGTAAARLQELTGLRAATADSITFRVCPGSHECQMGLAATRDVAAELLPAIAPNARQLDWAISGCPNSCTQPQLAAVGIVSARLKTDAEGSKTPRFDLYRRHDNGLGQRVAEGLELDQLLATVRAIN